MTDHPEKHRAVWIALMVGIGLEFALGVASLVLVPTDRPNQWIPAHGQAVYLAHAAVGGVLGIGALLVFFGAVHRGGVVLLGAGIGLVGLLLGAGGGVLTAFHPWRLAGIALMLAGTFVAFFGFLMALAAQIQGAGVGGSV